MSSKKAVGETGLQIMPLALGGNVFGWTADEETSFQILDQFVEAGGTLIDTADVYTGFMDGGKYGESERIIGKWIKARNLRGQVILATKVGYPMSPEKQGLSRAYILQAVEDSLTRLQTDYIDLYQSHRDDLNTPIEETLRAYADLIKAGKVRFAGASQCTPERLASTFSVSKTHSVARYSSLQPLYNLYERRSFESQFEEICLQQKIGVLPFYGLARGFLSGKYRSEQDLNKSVRGKDIKGYLNPRGLRILAALDEASDTLSATPAQISLAWLMAKPAITAPITSATNTDQLQDLLKSVKLKLSDEIMQKLDYASRYDD